MIFSQKFTSDHQKAARAAGGIANNIGRLGLSKLDHQPNDMTGGPELSVLAGGAELAQNVFVHVTFCVTILHRDVIDQLNNLCEKTRSWDREPGILHVPGVT